MTFRLLAALPCLGFLLGTPFTNTVEPYVLGLPFVLFWQVLWVVLGGAIMGLVYLLDPANRRGGR